jgi:transmembrane sensor
MTVEPVPAAELAERMAWRLPRLRFADAPLAEAVALINRHNRRQLVIEDGSLRELQISGVLRADNQTAFLEALRMNFGIEAVPVGDHEIRLRRRTAAVIN